MYKEGLRLDCEGDIVDSEVQVFAKFTHATQHGAIKGKDADLFQ